MNALIFDLDGVIADTSGAHFRSWSRLANETGIAFDERRNLALLGRTREDSLDIFLDGRDVTAAYREHLLVRKQSYFAQDLAAMSPADTLPGIRNLLEEARAASIPVGLASSSRNARAVLRQLDLSEFFNVIADGNSAVRPKPAPDIFLRVADELQTPPRRCVVIEDSEAGVQAAKAAGCRIISVGPRELAENHRETLFGVSLSEALS